MIPTEVKDNMDREEKDNMDREEKEKETINAIREFGSSFLLSFFFSLSFLSENINK